MTWLSFSSLRFALISLVLLVVSPAWVLTLYTAWEVHQHERNEVQKNALRLAQIASSHQERLIEEGLHLLVGLARLPEVQGCNSDACCRLFADILRQYPRYANLGAADPNGDVFCSAVPLRQPQNFANLPGFKRALKTREFSIGNYQIGTIVGKPVLPLAYPSLDASGRIQVVIFATLDLTWLNQFAVEVKHPPVSTLTVVDRNGLILIRHPNPENWVGRSMPEAPLIKTVMDRQTGGSTEVAGVDGVLRLYAFVPLRGTANADAYLLLGIPARDAFAETNRIFTRNLTWLGIGTLFMLIVAWVFGNMLVLRRVNALMDAARKLASGDLRVRTALPYGKGEIDQLAHCFDQMAEALEQREIERRQAEEALQKYANRLKILRQIDNAILVAQSPEEIAKATLEYIREIVPCVRASVVIFDLETYKATVLAVHCNGETSLGKGACVSLEVFGKIEELQQGKIHTAEDIQTLSQPEPAVRALQSDGIRSYINVPLVSRGELIGLLNLGSDRPGTFAPEYVEIAREVTGLLAVALQQARLFRSVSEHREQLHAMSARLSEAEEDERRRLAQELHDLVGQNLTALGINLNILRSQLSAEAAGKIRDRLEDSLRLVAVMTEDIRNVMAELCPPVLKEYGILAALQWYAERFSKLTGLATMVRGEDLMPRLPPDTEIVLFRIAQEALTNVAKHARAKQVILTLEEGVEEILLTIADDGIGFNPAGYRQPQELSKWGLITMRERAQQLGGHLRVESRPGKGTWIIAEIKR